MQTLVVEYTVNLKEGVTKDEFDQEVAETLDLMKGISRWNSLELPGGSIAFELHLHGQTDRKLATTVGERVYKTLVRFDMADIDYHGIEFPDEIQMAKDKWQGREPLEKVIKDFQGTTYIRLDYYAQGLSFDDLGISDANAEMTFVKAFQTWPDRTVARECIRRIRDHFQRLGELSDLGKLEKPRGRTGKAVQTLLTQPRVDVEGNPVEDEDETKKAEPAAATA